MKIAAVIIGVVAALGGAGIGFLGEMLMFLVSGGSYWENAPFWLRALFFGPPVVMLAAAIGSIWWLRAGGVVMLLSSAALVVLFPNFVLVAVPAALGILAGILALMAARKPAIATS